MPDAKTVSGETKIDLDPLLIYFTFSRIRATFSCGRTIASTLDQFLRGELTAHDLPLLCVLTDGCGHYFSQNNRRLYLYKELRRRGVLATVPVRLRQMPNTRRMRTKYTPEKCALEATLKREGNVALHEEDGRSGEGDSSSLNCNEDEGDDDDIGGNVDGDVVAQVDSVVRAADEEMLEEKRRKAKPQVGPQPPMVSSAPQPSCKRRKKKAIEKQQVHTRRTNGLIQSVEDELAELGLS